MLAGRDYPNHHGEFVAMFAVEAACEAYLERLRFPEGFACPRCGLLADR